MIPIGFPAADRLRVKAFYSLTLPLPFFSVLVHYGMVKKGVPLPQGGQQAQGDRAKVLTV